MPWLGQAGRCGYMSNYIHAFHMRSMFKIYGRGGGQKSFCCFNYKQTMFNVQRAKYFVSNDGGIIVNWEITHICIFQK